MSNRRFVLCARVCTQAFRIKVEPDVQEQPMSMDISSVVSKPITVLSKRINKPGKSKRPPGSSSVKRPAGACGKFLGTLFCALTCPDTAQ